MMSTLASAQNELLQPMLMLIAGSFGCRVDLKGGKQGMGKDSLGVPLHSHPI